MSVVSPIIELTKKKDKLMRKPRMTKSEKMFAERITALISKHPEKRNGVSYIDRTALNYLKPEIKEQYLNLLITKTR
jgi:hypothetical protein